MKRVITVLLAVLLVLSLAACGSGVETKKLAGTWTCTIDVTDRMNAAAEQALGLSAADGTAQMPLQLVLTVAEDGAYTLRYDSDAVRTALDAYAAALRPAAVESVYAAAEEHQIYFSSSKPSCDIIFCPLILRIREYLFSISKLHHLSYKEKCCLIRNSRCLLHVMRYHDYCIFLL